MINLLTTSPFLHDGKLSESDQFIWDALERSGEVGQLINPAEVQILFADNKTYLFDGTGTEIAMRNTIVRATRGFDERVYEIALLIERLGNTVTDSAVSLVYPLGKLLPFVHRQGKLPLVNTYFMHRTTTSNFDVPSILEYPFIVKPQKGFGGAGVYLIENSEQWLEYCQTSTESNIMVQTYIANIVAEFRVMICAGKSLGVAEKVSDQVARNAAQGAEFKAVSAPDVEAFAVTAASLQSGDVYGVDVVKNDAGELFLLECNRNPAFTAFRAATGVPVEDHIIALAR